MFYPISVDCSRYIFPTILKQFNTYIRRERNIFIHVIQQVKSNTFSLQISEYHKTFQYIRQKERNIFIHIIQQVKSNTFFISMKFSYFYFLLSSFLFLTIIKHFNTYIRKKEIHLFISYNRLNQIHFHYRFQNKRI